MPDMAQSAAKPDAWLNRLLGAADSAVKKWCKRDLELTSYTEYLSTCDQREVYLRQTPVWVGQTTITVGSNGAVLPTGTLNVVGTNGFHPGLGGNPTADPPTLAVQTGTSTWTTVTYTGTTPTSFTGCLDGTGTLATGYGVSMPVVWWDPQGWNGQSPNAFGPSTQLVMGTQWYAKRDSGGKVSNRGLIQRIGFSSGYGWWPSPGLYGGESKLGGRRRGSWPPSEDGLKVSYSAGYALGYLPGAARPSVVVPPDLEQAVLMLACYLVRNTPTGGPLASESLGAYSYSVLTRSPGIPEIGALQEMLSLYREISW